MVSQFLSMASPTKFYHVTQIILYMWLCDQSLVICHFYDRRNTFLEEWSWFKFNNLGLAWGVTLTFYTSASKGLKLKVRKFWEQISAFVDVTEEKLEKGGGFSLSPSSFLILKELRFLLVTWEHISPIRHHSIHSSSQSGSPFCMFALVGKTQF